MSAWTAINVEDDDDPALEIDDTKEIQLEEAFKLYQNALKFHSQGPEYYEAASQAYSELFQSEVFKYPEAASEFDAEQFDDPSPLQAIAPEVPVVPLAAGATADTANSLPKLVYLAHKSRAQFVIDVAHAQQDQGLSQDRIASFRHYNRACLGALADSAAALERDDTDLDLWKRASRVSNGLLTLRTVRFCLESVLAGDDEGDDAIDLSGLDEAFAHGELHDVLDALQDLLAERRTSSSRPKDKLLRLLKQSNDPYPFLPGNPRGIEYINEQNRPQVFATAKNVLKPVNSTQLSIARAFLTTITDQGSQDLISGTGAQLLIELPDEVVNQHTTVDGHGTECYAYQSGKAKDDGIEADLDSSASFHSMPNEEGIESVSVTKDMAMTSVEEQTIITQDEQAFETEHQEPASIDAQQVNATTVALPSRKRSSTVAGNEEPEARTKSKRIKAREARESMVGATTQEEDLATYPTSHYRERLSNIEAADDNMFKELMRIFESLGVRTLGSVDSLRNLRSDKSGDTDPARPGDEHTELSTMMDLQHALKTWNEERYAAFTSGHQGRDRVEKSTGLSLFLKHTKNVSARDAMNEMVEDPTLIQKLASVVNKSSMSTQEALFFWLTLLLTRQHSSSNLSIYLQGTWLSELKQAIIDILLATNEAIVASFRQHVASTTPRSSDLDLEPEHAAEFAQTMFELHLDKYSELMTPTSTADQSTRKRQSERLEVWWSIATDMVQSLTIQDEEFPERVEQLSLRFLWASVVGAKLSEPVDKSHVLLCLRDLQHVLRNSKTKEMLLPNNSTMPLISVAAAEQEISKVETLEFFMSVFDSDNSDPIPVIEKLEPILELGGDLSPYPEHEREQIISFHAFLDSGDASLTLFLWKRLQNAYTAISYNTKVVSCLFRSLEVIAQEMASAHQADKEATERQNALLQWLRDADELIANLLGKIADDRSAFESIDEAHLQSSLSAVVFLLRLAHCFAITDDSLQMGIMTPPPLPNSTQVKNFDKCRDKLREMYVRLCTLLYLMIKEASNQMAESFQNSTDDLISYLRCIHACLGARQWCKHCNKLFVRVMKTELFAFDTQVDLSLDIAQVVFDLYQVKMSTGFGDADHGCTADSLDRDKKTAQTLVPIIMNCVKRLNVKDLLRSDLKSTIDKIQNVLGQAKPSTAVSFNRRAVSAYLKSLINPRQLYQALKGIGELATKTVHGDFAILAGQGWYLLLGNMTLAKYRSVKRVNPTPTDDLDIALGYLRQDIEHDSTNWESWYRLAQVHDAKIEDNLIWNSNKLNDGRAELATLERNAINAYTMATALAVRSAPDDKATSKMVTDMLFEFATRLYSSSRPPLDMEAFKTEKAVRHLSNYYSQTMSKQPLIRPMTEYKVWAFATHLIYESLAGEDKPWLRYYMLGKCLWKMFRSQENEKTKAPIEVDEVIDAVSEAVNVVPKKERTDPILEPHYKLVSIIHKLHDFKIISMDEALRYLQVTSYAKGVRLPGEEQGERDWEAYILMVLKKLQNADKSGWHHRISARAAHVLYDDVRNTTSAIRGALGARLQFIDSIFTKNMTMQVWKPENERPGRHYVHTGRYLRFFIEILDVLKDRSNLEQVVRKIRRKTTDFIDHTKIWEDAVITYVNLLRRLANIPAGKERALFDSITFDEFTRQSEKLEAWAHEPETTTHFLDTIKDAIEMKKLNNSLMKGSAIDDLIGDTYACMYELFVSQLPSEEQVAATPQPPPLPQGTFINLTQDTAPSGDDNVDRMRMNHLISGQTDGAAAIPREGTTRPAGLGIVTTVSPSINTPPPDASRPAPAKPGRAKTITRREVQRKAEGAIGKPPPIKTPTLTKRIIVIVPSVRKEGIVEKNDDDDNDEGSLRNRANGRSETSSRRGSVSARNSAEPDAGNDDEDEGGYGDNEEEDDDDNEVSDAEPSSNQSTRKRLFPGLEPQETKEDNDEDDEDDEEEDGEDEEDEGDEGDEEGEEGEGAEDADEDKMSDVQETEVQGNDDNDLEIPNSQDDHNIES